jgi:murein DD-endopeptidase MepM/ murein hydrolase activator NlpD
MLCQRSLLFALISIFIIAGCGHLSGRAPLHEHNPAGSWYVVKQGDTSTAIANRAGIPLVDFLEINGLQRADPLTPGQVVFILDPRPATPAIPPSAEDRFAKPSSGGGREARFRWPLHRPILTSSFGTRWGRPHEGIDMAGPIGTPVYAAAAGTVIYAGDRVKGYGNMVVLQHEDGFLTVYAHNSALRVRTGDRVTQGQEIALLGDSGRSTAPHLHFEVRKGEIPLDPIPFLPPLK